MAQPRRKRGPQGRVTPRGATPPTRRGSPRDPAKPVQIGRRPSNAGFLLLVGVMWIGVGLFIGLSMSWSWRLVPAILAAGIGLFFLRGAGSTVIRRDQRQSGSPGA